MGLQAFQLLPIWIKAMIQMEACPFCNGLPEISKHFREEMWRLNHTCEVVGTISFDWQESPDELAKRWNRRSSPAQSSSNTAQLKSDEGDLGSEVMDEFSKGVFFAASVLVKVHDRPTEAADILNEAGLAQANVSDLDDYEKEAMQELMKQEARRLKLTGLEVSHD